MVQNQVYICKKTQKPSQNSSHCTQQMNSRQTSKLITKDKLSGKEYKRRSSHLRRFLYTRYRKLQAHKRLKNKATLNSQAVCNANKEGPIYKIYKGLRQIIKEKPTEKWTKIMISKWLSSPVIQKRQIKQNEKLLTRQKGKIGRLIQAHQDVRITQTFISYLAILLYQVNTHQKMYAYMLSKRCKRIFLYYLQYSQTGNNANVHQQQNVCAAGQRN